MKKYFRFIVLTLSFLLVLTACGSGNSAPSKTLNVTMTDFQFTPNTFTIPARAQIAFTGVNNGAVEHSFVIMKLGYKVKDHYTDADTPNVYWGKLSILPGQTVTDTFTAPTDPGEYQIVCQMPGHFEAGMIGTLIVK